MVNLLFFIHSKEITKHKEFRRIYFCIGRNHRLEKKKVNFATPVVLRRNSKYGATKNI